MKAIGKLAALFSLSLALIAAARGQGDAGDPFARANRALPKLSASSKKIAELVQLKATVEPAQAKPGDVVKLIIKGSIKPGYHTYSLTKKTPDQGAISELALEEHRELTPLWPIRESEPHFVINEIHKIDLEHTKDFTWSQDILIAPDATPGMKEFDVLARLQVCKERCYGPDLYPPFEARVEVVPGPRVVLTPEIQKRLDEKAPPMQVVAPPGELVAKAMKAEADTALAKKTDTPKAAVPGVKPPTPTTPDGQVDKSDLWALLGAAFGGTFLMLLTPCVFPMIPITVNFFLKQSEKEHHNPLRMASVYSGTIILMLTLVMLVLGNVVIALANNAWFNLALGGVLILFALSLFGMFELELPSFLARYTSSHEGQGGLAGTIFMALTFTITSFTCTGPFLGVMLAPIAGIKPPLINLILAALVYSATFAAPFFVLALFPSMMKKLPKSGGWLNVVKVVMGFLELGAALKFLSNTDIAWNPGNPRLFNFDTVLAAWIALSFACGLYLIGVFRLPHDDPPEHVGVLRMLFATIFFGLTVYMIPAMFGYKLRGFVGENMIAFLPPKLDDGNSFAGLGNPSGRRPHLAWHRYYEDAWKDAVKENKLILIDFTGVNCTNCRDNEENVFPRPDVVEEMSRYVRAQLYTDTVPDSKLTSGQAKEQAQRNERWRDTIADPSNPNYVVFRPDRDQPFDADGQLKGQVVNRVGGKIFDVPKFVAFLREPLTAEAKRNVAWHLNYKAAWQEAVKEKKLIFINFTSVNNVYCRDNEENVLKRPEVAAELAKYARVQLYGDHVPSENISADQATKEAERNARQRDHMADPTTPRYILFRPDYDAPFDAKDLLKGTIVDTVNGKIFDVAAFQSFLKRPFEAARLDSH